MSSQEELALQSDDNAADTAVVVAPAQVSAPSMANSLAWNAAGDWITQIISWACFPIIVRLLSPADYGLVAMAGTFGPLVAYFSGNGIPRAIVTLRHLTEDQLAQLNTVGTILGFVSFGMAVAIAKPLSWFYGNSRVGLVFVVGCIGLIFNGIQTVSNALLLRDMQFRLLTIFGAISAVIGSLLTLLLAWLGWGYWALVLSGLPPGIIRTVLVMRTRRQTYAWPRWQSVREPLKFAAFVVLSLIAWSFYQNLDNLTAGRFLGQVQLGYYAMAWSLAYVPLDKVTSLVTAVMPSYFAAIQHDLVAVRRHLLKLTEVIAFLMFPSCVGFGLVADGVIPLVLGQKWTPAVAPLEVLSIYAAFRSIVALLPKVLAALQNPRYVMLNDVSAIFVLGVAFYIGSHWGITGIAWGWVLAYPFVVVPLYRKTFSTIGMNVADYLRALGPALEGTIVMSIAVLLVKRWMAGDSHTHLLTRTIVEVLTGVSFYVAILLLRHRERTFEVLKLAKQFRQGGGQR